MFGGDRDGLAFGGRHRAGLGVGEIRPAARGLAPWRASAGADAAVELADDAVLPAHGLRQVEARRRGRALMPRRLPPTALAIASNSPAHGSAPWTECSRGSGRCRRAGRLDEHRVEAELAGADRGDIAARAAADDEDFGMRCVRSSGLRHEQKSPAVRAGLDLLDERGGVLAVDDAVIEGRRQVHHLAHDDLAVAHDRALDDLVGADDRHLGMVDHRRRRRGRRARRGSVIVMVEPVSSSRVPCRPRGAARAARSSRALSQISSASAWRTTGTIRPVRASASRCRYERRAWRCTTPASSSKRALICGYSASELHHRAHQERQQGQLGPRRRACVALRCARRSSSSVTSISST